MTRKIRVIQFGLGMPHDQYVGGAEVFAASLAQALDQDRFERLVCGVWQFNSANEALQRNALAAKNIASELLMPYDPNIRSIARAVQPLVNLIRRWQADIVTTHAEYADLISLAARQLHRVRYTPVRVVHLLPEFDIVGRYRPALAATLRRLHPLLCSTDIGISPQIAATMGRKWVSRRRGYRLQMIPNALDTDAIRARVSGVNMRAEFGLTRNTPWIGIVGRLEPQKGLAFFLQAAREVYQACPQAKFLIVGAGSLRHELEAQARSLGLADRVTFTGVRDDVPDLLANLDVLVSSSLREGLPTILMEAMVIGTPIVSSDIPGSRDLITHERTGRLVPAQDAHALAQAILRILRERDQAQTMTQAAKIEVEQFSINSVARQYEALYTQLLASHTA